MDNLQLEMNNIMVEFEEYEGDLSNLVGHEYITGHMVLYWSGNNIL